MNLFLNQHPHSLQWMDPDPGTKFTFMLKKDQKKHVQNFLGIFSFFFLKKKSNFISSVTF